MLITEKQVLFLLQVLNDSLVKGLPNFCSYGRSKRIDMFEIIVNQQSDELIELNDASSRETDPTLYHCQHELGKKHKYPYCPFCGQKINS